jgi:hypothetical protein
MLIGLDFDNTIACYDKAIRELSNTHIPLPEGLSRTKEAIKSYLIKSNRESEWTRLQGELYGPGMVFAEPSAECISTLQEIVRRGHKICIVSHRSLRPYGGQDYDLHVSAKNWIYERLECLISTGALNIDKNVFFETTLEQKIRRIDSLSACLFVDDLVKVLKHREFPLSTYKRLYLPGSRNGELEGIQVLSSWPRLLDDIES